MMRRYSFPKRIIAMLLSIVMVMSFMPSLGISAQAAAGSAIADAGTMDDWKSFFDPDNVSTEHAGGIWTDKSVFTDNSAFPAGTVTVPGTDHFLVALSALGSNSIVVGQGTKPTDTVFVLDVSGSMNDTSGAVSNMVKAANDAIRSLMAANEENRVGVVLYSSSATTLLPLDHYTGVTWTQTNQEYYFIATSDSNGGGGGGGGNGTSITTNIPTSTTSSGGGGCEGGGGQTQTETRRATGSDGNQVSSVTRQVTGGTYIQGGLWEAWENHFNTAADTTSRTPSIVLMSDGAPTYNSSAFDNVDEDNYTHGAGNNSFAGDGFVTQLTAAVVKANVANKYQSQAYMYTIGFGLDAISGTRNKSVATAVLDPTDSPYEDITNYWTTYKALATTSSTMNVGLGINQGQNDTTENVTISKSSVDLFNGTYYKSGENYVDKFFSADDASDLSSVFQNIVNEINLQAGYYPTRLDDNGTNFSGYVSFVDEIGTGMEVEHVHGILVGDTLYTGKQIAQILWNTDQNNTILKNMNGGVLPTQMTAEMEAALEYDLWLGTRYQPTALGDEFVWAVMQRLGLPNREVAWEVIGNAWNDDQLSYDPVTGAFSNYIGWYGDSEGNYVAPWSSTDAAAPEGAEYINMCYGMVGTTTASSLASDMMYVTVQVSHKITTDEQIVTFRIPASLLPTVTYRVNVTLNDNNEIVEDGNATIEYVAADPIRLVYEVGVNEDIVNEITIAQYGTPAPAGSADEGKYYLYTNQWHAAATGDTANDHIAYSYFESSEENEHYYFTEDTLVYTSTDGGATLTPATTYDANATYYYQHRIFAANGTATEGKYPAAFRTVNQEIDKSVILAAHEAGSYDANGQLYIAAGTVRKNLHDHDAAKSENKTGTFSEVREQMVSDQLDPSTETHHYELTYLGNNGRLTYEPATGISLTKNMVTGVVADGVKFPFTVNLTSTTGLTYTLQSADGTLSAYTPDSVTDTTVKVAIEAGQTLYITGMVHGASYTVTEDYIDGYQQSSSSGANGTAVRGTLQPVIFTNDEWDLSLLSITKDVTYNGGVSAPATLPEFDVTVTLKKANGDLFSSQSVLVNGVAQTTGTDGTLNLTITDGQVITIANLPVGATYTVAEGAITHPGYSGVTTSASGTIDLDGEVAALVNEYTPDGITITAQEPGISIDLEKIFFINEGSGSGYWFNRSKTFEFELLELVDGEWTPIIVNESAIKTQIEFVSPNYGTTVETGTNTKSGSLSMAGVTFNAAGSHYFRVAEVIPAEIEAGYTYDRTYHDFEVVVADDHASGKLVISEVKSLQNAVVTSADTDGNGNAEHWNVDTSFYNSKIVGSTKLTIQANKTLVDVTTGTEVVLTLKDGQFEFALYETDSNFSVDGLAPIATAKNGITGAVLFPTINYQFTANGASKTYYYVVKETSTDGNGITVDDTVYKIAVTVKQVGSALEISQVLVNDNAVTLGGNNILNGDTIAFKNTYKAAAVTADALTALKVLDDHTPGAVSTSMSLADWDFSFTLTGNGENQTKQNDNNGIVTFDKITYTTAGTYTYTITENDTDYVGVTKDNGVIVVTVVVKDDGEGSLYIESTTITKNNVPVDHIAFQNIYKAVPPEEPGGNTPGDGSPVEVVLSGMKVLQLADGKNLSRTIQPGEFSFVLKDADGNEIETVTNGNGDNANNIFSFSALKFDTLGEYTYTISEVKGIAGGIGYTDKTVTVKVTVTDEEKDGVMEVKVDGAVDIEFTNTYDVGNATLDMTASKHLSGRPMTPGEFSFTLTGLNGAPMPEGVTGTTVDASNAAGGAINFGTITYSAAGEYQYTIVENKPDGYVADANGLYKGVKYDENTYTVTVTVEDKLDGTLYAYVSKVEVGNTETTLDIHNRYEIHDSETVTLGGSKVVNDTTSETPKTAGDFEFSFVLKNENGDVLETITNNGAGFTFAAKTYTAPAQEVYWIEELANGIPGMTYDATKYKVTITITDDGVGGLNQSVVYEKLKVDAEGNPVTDDLGNYTFDAADSADFVNGYAAEAAEPITITGYKKFPGGRDIVDGEFQFILTKPNGSTETKGNVGYIFTFDPITYTVEGTYVYTLVEKLEGIEVDADGNYIKDGVKYDPTEFTITVTVTDVNGKLTTSTAVTQTGGTENLTEYGFTNVFIPEAVSTTIEVKKLLENLSDEAMGLDGFVFELYRVDTEETKTASSDADGKASFQLSFTGADVGKTYEYRLSEDDSADVEGMDYDNTVYTIFITVNQNSTTGALSLDVKCGTEALTGALEFENTYDPPVPPTTTEEEPPTTTEEEPPTTTEEEPPTTTEEEPPTTTEEEPPTTTEEEPPSTSEEAPPTTEEDPSASEPETSEPETSDPGDSTDPTGGNDDGDKDPTDDEPPKTMDETDLIGWTMMMSVSAICLLAVLVLGKKLVFETA